MLTNEQKAALKTAIEHMINSTPEIQEEGSTGADMLQTLRTILHIQTPKSHKFDYKRSREYPVFPTHPFISSHAFKADETEEADFATATATLAEKNGMSAGEIHKALPFMLRMLKSKSQQAE